MTVLSKGANAPLPTGPVSVAVAGAQQGSVDLMAFLLGPDGKVRSDADFIFFNQPRSAEGAVQLVATDRIQVDLALVPGGVESLAVAVVLDDAVRGSLATITGLGVAVTAGGGSVAVAHQAQASGLTVERAAVLVEIYRRAGAWKLRNVSAGWAAGLPALVREHGVSVDEESAPPADQAAALPPASLPPASSLPAPFPPARHPAAVLPAASLPPASLRNVQGQQAVSASGYPTPGGYPPPGGSLPPRPDFVPPHPGGWRPPGGPLQS